MSKLETPEGTRLILVATDLLGKFGTRTDDGREITAEWGDPSTEGWYEPVFTASGPPLITNLWDVALALALYVQHLPWCDVAGVPRCQTTLSCTCGLDTYMEQLEENVPPGQEGL